MLFNAAEQGRNLGDFYEALICHPLSKTSRVFSQEFRVQAVERILQRESVTTVPFSSRVR